MRRKAFITVGGHEKPGQNKYEQNGGDMNIMVLLYVEDKNFKLSMSFFPSSSHLLQLEARKITCFNVVSKIVVLQQSL